MVNKTYTNISGKTFGSLTAIKPTTKRVNNSVVWVVQCTCGKYDYKSASQLRTRASSKCYCCVRIGDTYNELTVIEACKNDKWGNKVWYCQCTCGEFTFIRQPDLKSGHIKTCGCLSNRVSTKHGMYLSAEYKAWDNMKQRCSNPNHEYWGDYGGFHSSTFIRIWGIDPS